MTELEALRAVVTAVTAMQFDGWYLSVDTHDALDALDALPVVPVVAATVEPGA